MKDLKDFILEASKTPFDELIDLTYSCIDYLYNEGIVDYDEKHLAEYARNSEKIPYSDIAKVLLLDYKKYIDSKLEKILKDLEKNGPKKEKNMSYPVQDAIAQGIEKFAKEANLL